jgi:uncharacterized protein YicC (UPF0701 family)
MIAQLLGEFKSHISAKRPLYLAVISQEFVLGCHWRGSEHTQFSRVARSAARAAPRRLRAQRSLTEAEGARLERRCDKKVSALKELVMEAVGEALGTVRAEIANEVSAAFADIRRSLADLRAERGGGSGGSGGEGGNDGVIDLPPFLSRRLQ